MYARPVVTTVAGAALVIAAALAAVPTMASQRATVTLRIPNNRVTANERFRISYASPHVPRGSTLYLQGRAVAGSSSWKTVKALAGLTGSTWAPPVPIGKYDFRVMVAHRGISSIVSQAQVVFSYGSVPFATVCKLAPASSFNCISGSASAGSQLFSYAAILNASAYPGFNGDIHEPSTTCRSATLHWVAYPSPYDVSWLRVVESRHGSQTGEGVLGSVGTLHALLYGGPWILEAADGPGPAVAVNGTLSCYTSGG